MLSIKPLHNTLDSGLLIRAVRDFFFYRYVFYLSPPPLLYQPFKVVHRVEGNHVTVWITHSVNDFCRKTIGIIDDRAHTISFL